MRFTKTVLLGGLIAAGITGLQASQIVLVTLDSYGTLTNSNNNLIGPDTLTISTIGGAPSTITAECYDFTHQVTPGQHWSAYEYTVAEAAAHGQFSGGPDALAKYTEAAWLTSLIASATNNQARIDLQEDIWNLFDPGAFAVTPAMAAYANPAPGNFDSSKALFFESISGKTQAFVESVMVVNPGTPTIPGGPPVVVTPDPSTAVMSGIGFLLLWVGMRRKKGVV